MRTPLFHIPPAGLWRHSNPYCLASPGVNFETSEHIRWRVASCILCREYDQMMADQREALADLSNSAQQGQAGNSNNDMVVRAGSFRCYRNNRPARARAFLFSAPPFLPMLFSLRAHRTQRKTIPASAKHGPLAFSDKLPGLADRAAIRGKIISLGGWKAVRELHVWATRKAFSAPQGGSQITLLWSVALIWVRLVITARVVTAAVSPISPASATRIREMEVVHQNSRRAESQEVKPSGSGIR